MIKKPRQRKQNRRWSLGTLEGLEARHLLAGDFMAGDANQDYFFNESDFVLAHQGGKFDTGEAATWSEGDWNEDGEYNSGDYVAAFINGLYQTGPYDLQADEPQHLLQPLSAPGGDADVTVLYNAENGTVSIFSELAEMSTLHLRSEAGYFVHGSEHQNAGLFDVSNSTDLFVLNPSGLGSIEYPSVALSGLTSEQLLNDLSIEGSFTSGSLGNVVLVVSGDPNIEIERGRIEGFVFDDSNSSGTKDAGEQNYKFGVVQVLTSDGKLVRSGISSGVDFDGNGSIGQDEAGYFSFGFLPDGDYTVKLQVHDTWKATTESEIAVTVPDGTTVDGLEFGIVRQRPVPVDPPPTPEGIVHGDANEDFYFGPADLVQVSKAGKFETNDAATWAEGDWNGDNKYNSSDFVTAFSNSFHFYAKGPYNPDAGPESNELAPISMEGAADVVVFYDSTTGDVAVEGIAGALTTVYLVSELSIFAGASEVSQTGLFDVNEANRLFTLDPGGSHRVFGYSGAAQTGLTDQEFLNAVKIDGSLFGGGSLGNVRLGAVADMPEMPAPNERDGIRDGNNGNWKFVAAEDANVLFVYNQTNGDITISGIGDISLTTIEVISNSGIFINTDNPTIKPGLFDVAVAGKLFRLDPSGLASIEYPGVAPTGLTAEELHDDLILSGSILGGGGVSVTLEVVADEIAAVVLECRSIIAEGAVPGDANLDGVFDTKDFVAVFQAGHYEDGIPENSSWHQGDFNCDMEFDSSDMVAAFMEDNFIDGAAAITNVAAATDRQKLIGNEIGAEIEEFDSIELATRLGQEAELLPLDPIDFDYNVNDVQDLSPNVQSGAVDEIMEGLYS